MIPQKVTVCGMEKAIFWKFRSTMPKTADGNAMVKLDNEGNILGFHIPGISKTSKKKPFEVELKPGPKREMPE